MNELIMLLSFFLNFILTGFEVAYLTLTFSYISREDANPIFIRNPRGVITTILIFSNLSQIAFSISFLRILLRFMEAHQAALVSAVLSATILLIFSEYIPKYVARLKPELFFGYFKHLVVLLYYMVFPITYMFVLLPRKDTKEFLEEYIEQLAQVENLESREVDFLKRSVKLFSRRIEDIAKPFEDYAILDVSELEDPDKVRNAKTYIILVRDGSEIKGYMYKKDYFLLGGKYRTPIVLSSKKYINEALERMRTEENNVVFADGRVLTIDEIKDYLFRAS